MDTDSQQSALQERPWTPGPWRVFTRTAEGFSDQSEIWAGFRTQPGHGDEVACTHTVSNGDEHANAALIALAPRMAAAILAYANSTSKEARNVAAGELCNTAGQLDKIGEE